MTDEQRTPDDFDDLPLEHVTGVGDPLLPLPGRSTEYEIYLFRCGVCGEENRMMFMDAGESPRCARDPGHGETTWVR
ncbi:hypothetical protein [Streptomyces cucumeris]|uniref:hypothetical protein n=1 Tax=Streptomyces cucumeris TaxID=2962890 RepID=UPI0020C8F12F|nr:hypothetical protein [Streptomyces sp. NEAU-Y11]MCP9207868.1 hypothetical protein [Streptomyces sp. NEAU-Y11]